MERGATAPLGNQVATLTDPRSLSTTYTVDGLGNLLTLASPDTGTTNATYDAAGNLKTRTDARGVMVSYSYDALNRLTQIAYGDQTVVVTWDSCANGVGRLCKLTDASGSTAFAYNSQGRIATKSQTIGSVVLPPIQYGYDADGRPASLTTPAGKLIAYDWSDGVLSGLRVNGTAQLANISYRPFGPVAGWTWGNGQTVLRRFDAAGRLESVSFGNNITGAVDTQGLAYDAAGRIIALVDGLDTRLNQTHGYDGLDRLTSSRLTGASLTTYGYSYDLSGNRATRVLNGVGTTYATPTTSNRLMSLSGGQSKAYGYDNAGNIKSDGTLSFGYDNAGRRTWSKSGSVTTTYTYNALGQRVKKVGPNGTTLYAYDEAGQLIGEYDGSGAAVQETVWLGEIPVLTLRGANVYYVHADHLNTPRRVTRPSDNKPVWMWEAEPFGNALPDQNPAALGTFVYNLRMPGQVYDQETGLFQNYWRDYDSGTGRYTTSDPIGLAGGINTYAYGLNDPLRNTDPFGLWSAEAHNAILRAAFPNLSPSDLNALMLGSADVDDPIFQIPGIGDSSTHAMRDPGQSIEDARKKYCNYIQDQLGRYNRYKDKAYMRNYALRSLGRALHPIMDSTSPAHRGFQVWPSNDILVHGDGKYSIEDINHLPPYLAETVGLINDLLAGNNPCPCGK